MLPGSQGELGDSVWGGHAKATPSYLKTTQSLGPAVGRSIAPSLCTQDLPLSREPWQGEEGRCVGSSCHQLSWLALLQFLTSIVVTVLCGCREQLDRNRSKKPCLQWWREQRTTVLKNVLKEAFSPDWCAWTRGWWCSHTPELSTLCPIRRR